MPEPASGHGVGSGDDDSPGDGGRAGTTSQEAISPTDRTAVAPTRPTQAPPSEGSFGWRGWVLVGMLILSFLVIPWLLISLPAARAPLGSLGLSLRDAYLTLPMIPAILLGVVAVWAAVRSRAE